MNQTIVSDLVVNVDADLKFDRKIKAVVRTSFFQIRQPKEEEGELTLNEGKYLIYIIHKVANTGRRFWII